MCVIVYEMRVLRTKVIDRLEIVEGDFRKRFRFSCKLFLCRFDVIFVNVHVTEGVHELAWFAAKYFCDYHRQKSVASDVEWYAKENIGRALVQLETHFSVFDIELVHIVANRKTKRFFGLCHFV